MSYFDDNEGRITGLSRLRLAREDITCKVCGADCYWQEIIDRNGLPKVRLFAEGKPHNCRPAASADEFEDVS